MDVGEALRGHVEGVLNATVSKYFERAIDASAVFSKDGQHGFKADISVHPGRGFLVQGSGAAGSARAAFDDSMGRIDKQLRRYKRRLKDYHKTQADEKIIAAQRYVIAPEEEGEDVVGEVHPVIIAEMPTAVATLSVSEAVMRMDLADVSAMMFRNSAHGELNVVYRRADGNIGWIDPSGT